MGLFNRKPKTVEEIAYKQFLKDSWMFDSPKSKIYFEIQTEHDNYYFEQASLKMRKEKIKKIKSKIKK